MKILDTRKKEFLEWTVKQDTHIHASDAELEEMYGTPKHRHGPEHDWELNGQHLKKGK